MAKSRRRRREFWAEGKRIRRVYVHRLVVERVLGRELLSTETVHHINGNPGDNRLDNLIVFSSQSAHMFYHHYNWRLEVGVGHLFGRFDHLQIAGGAVVWGTDTGLRGAFGEDWRRVRQAMLDVANEVALEHRPRAVDRSYRNERPGTRWIRKWSQENAQVVLNSSIASHNLQ